MKILGFNIERTKAQRSEVIVNEEALYRMLYESMSPFIKLKRDSNMIDTITDGYESSPNVFSIVNRCVTMFSGIPYKVFQGEKELETGPIEALFENNPADYTFDEYRQVWEAMGMITGNAITFYMTRSGTDGLMHLQLAPSQHVEIVYGTWLDPVKGYKLDLASDDSKIIPPENIWHVRHFPNLDFREGKNYMGISPVRVAARVINSEIFGNELVESSFKRGMPPGILARKDMPSDIGNIEAQRKAMEATWDKKYSQRDKQGKPIFTAGELAWIPIGFSNLRDLQITDVNKMALRALCNVWGIPSRVMNDMEGGSYTKDKEDRKAIYTNRLIPDNKLFWNGINKLIKSTGIRYEPDYTDIPELQEDKKEMAEIFQIGYNSNSVQVNEFREKLQLEQDPEMEGLYKNDIETGPLTQPLPPDKL